MDNKDFEEIAKMRTLENMDHWYSWESPIGLSIFLVTLAGIGIAIAKLFFK